MFGLTESLALDIDDKVAPSVVVGDVVDSPYLEYAIPCLESHLQAGSGVDRTYVIARPGKDVALQILQVSIRNSTVAAQTIAMRLFNANDISGISLTAASEVGLMQAAGRTVKVRRTSTLIGGNATTTRGEALATFEIPAGTVLLFDFPKPGIILYGDDPTGTPGFGISNVLPVNADISLHVYAREWPLKK